MLEIFFIQKKYVLNVREFETINGDKSTSLQTAKPIKDTRAAAIRIDKPHYQFATLNITQKGI